MFNNSSSHHFSSGTFSIVHGNQHNTYFLRHEDRAPVEEEWKVKLQREYDRIPMGRIKILRNVAEKAVWRREYEGDHLGRLEERNSTSPEAKRVFLLVCLVNGRKDSRPFLSVVYTGRDAQKVFKYDCIAFSRIRNAHVMQLRGFNDSDTPMILFHEELIPVQKIVLQHHECSLLLQCYFCLQASIARYSVPEWHQTQLGSYNCRKVWIQTRNGRISFGPEGPRTYYFPVEANPRWELESHSDMPVLHTGLYDTNRLLDYLVKYSSDKFFLDSLVEITPGYISQQERYSPISCQAWARSSGRPIARFQAWWTYMPLHPTFTGDVCFPTITTEDGRIRFSIKSMAQIRDVLLWFSYIMDMPSHSIRMSWLSQACSVFSTLNIPKDEWSDCALIHSVYLGFTRNSEATVPDDLENTCYLFLLPPPRLVDGSPDIKTWVLGKDLYYWSPDPDGQSVIPHSQHVSLGLPSLVPDFWTCSYTTTSDTYDIIWAWQEKRGFDPTTTDFARSLGFPIMEVISGVDEERFKILSKVTDSLPSVVKGSDRGEEIMDVDSSTLLQADSMLGYEDANMVVEDSLTSNEGPVPVETDMEVD